MQALFAQENLPRYGEIGLEFQQYPTGTLAGIRGAWSPAPHHTLELRLGYNIVYHGDAGVHQLEEGGGFGFTPGFQYWFKPTHEGFFLGARMDVWFNSIDWKDNMNTTEEISGTTKITVLQPTAILGYGFSFDNQLSLVPTLAFGVEINTNQEGENVGEGAILLAGLQLNYRF